MWIPTVKWVSREQEPLGICVWGKISKALLGNTYHWQQSRGNMHPYWYVCGETRIPRDMCAGNTLPGETYYHCDHFWYFLIASSNTEKDSNKLPTSIPELISMSMSVIFHLPGTTMRQINHITYCMSEK